jgi:hypothetical protein
VRLEEKLAWNVGLDPAARFEALAAFLDAEGLAAEAADVRLELAALRSAK